MTDGHNNPVAVSPRLTELSRQKLEVVAIVGQERLVLAGSVGELIDIARTKAARIARGNGRKAVCPNKIASRTSTSSSR